MTALPDEAINAVRKAIGYAIAKRCNIDPEEMWAGPGATAQLDDDTPPWPYWQMVTDEIAADLPAAIAAALPYLRPAAPVAEPSDEAIDAVAARLLNGDRGWPYWEAEPSDQIKAPWRQKARDMLTRAYAIDAVRPASPAPDVPADAVAAAKEQGRAEAREELGVFVALAATEYGRAHYGDPNMLHPHHYDLMEKCDLRMDDFTRACAHTATEEAKENAHG
ncbi:hypothetical protein M2322_002803 [Rhodoblastus acidophilus]|uniref:hypothetical protein n=1 Tax=Rhodoblastus acidophilus TaxID=1074 RepID=UPI002224F1C4|nr:hypothetical protein [Rhodoblastus acidophilus]MCW2317244.1 hypothetical protein [Rhodoblastus acidophilus]